MSALFQLLLLDFPFFVLSVRPTAACNTHCIISTASLGITRPVPPSSSLPPYVRWSSALFSGGYRSEELPLLLQSEFVLYFILGIV